MLKRKIKRGDIFNADLGYGVGSEQGDLRPVLVVQNNVGNRFSPTIVVTPITSNLHKTKIPTHVVIPRSCGLEKDSLVLVEQIRAIDRSRLEDYLGSVISGSNNDSIRNDERRNDNVGIMEEIDKALAVCVGLKFMQRTRREQP